MRILGKYLILKKRLSLRRGSHFTVKLDIAKTEGEFGQTDRRSKGV